MQIDGASPTGSRGARCRWAISARVRLVSRLFRSWRLIDLRGQLIHGDLVGNVLFAGGLPPAIIDLSLYWRPPRWSAALVVGDAIAWEGAEASLIDMIRHFDEWPQLLLRVVIFRVAVSELARRAEPWRMDVSDDYDGIVELAVSPPGQGCVSILLR